MPTALPWVPTAALELPALWRREDSSYTMDRMLRRNVLIFQTGGLGDFILTWPFAVALGRIYPQSRIIYITHQQKGDLARRVLRLEAADIENGWHGLFTDRCKLPDHAQRLIESSHAIFSFLPVNQAWNQNIERINMLARRVSIDTRIGPEFSGHLTDKIISDLENSPLENSALQQMLRSIADRGIGFKPMGGTDVVIHPGSGSPAKCWPLDHYVELSNRLKQAGRTVRFVIGEVEQEKWSAGNRQQLKSCAALRDCTTYLDLLDEIQTAGCFIGNDSGPAHLAGIIGLPTLALFGPTNPTQWRPLGPHVSVLQHATVDDVFNLITANSSFSGRPQGAPSLTPSTDDDE